MMNIKNNKALSRFELEVTGDVAYADYAISGNVLSIKYVFAPETLRGTGAAGHLMEGIVDYARDNGLKIYPICGYAVSWLRRHPEAADLQA